eukprot:TRINITY_DN14576_c0_g1_i4.p1 TRINITY_DN14576_c0_g1~~TRINITY_DN14576_c0_g1_i4.p1  ORF type:complete len:246 (-),score=71.68 TRINITY_DN14576_c0_g1_i4:66-803(-)
MRRYWGRILGCAGGWFLFDITFYGNSLFESTVLAQVFKVPDSKGGVKGVTGELKDNLCWQMLIVALIGLPGYYVALFLMDKIGRRNMQLQGFLCMAIVYAILGIFKHKLDDVPSLMLVIYGLTFFFSNFGPNSTTFALPAETFPAQVRTTLNGFSAALGKAGATLGSSTFKKIEDSTSLGFTMVLCAGVSLLGLVITYFFVLDMRGKPMDGDEELYEEINPTSGGEQPQHGDMEAGRDGEWKDQK